MRTLWQLLLIITTGLIFFSLFLIAFQSPSEKEFFNPYSFSAYAEDLKVTDRGLKSSTLQLTLLLNNSRNTANAEVERIDFSCYLDDLELANETFVPEGSVGGGDRKYVNHNFKIDYGKKSSVLENMLENKGDNLRVVGTVYIEAKGEEYGIEIVSTIKSS